MFSRTHSWTPTMNLNDSKPRLVPNGKPPSKNFTPVKFMLSPAEAYSWSPLIGRSHMTIGMTTGWQTGRHTDRRYRSHMTTGVQTGVPTDRRYVHT